MRGHFRYIIPSLLATRFLFLDRPIIAMTDKNQYEAAAQMNTLVLLSIYIPQIKIVTTNDLAKKSSRVST